MNNKYDAGDPFADLPTVTLDMVAAAAANLKRHDARDHDILGNHDAKTNANAPRGHKVAIL